MASDTAGGEWAVGVTSANGFVPLAEHFDGTSWSITPSATPAMATGFAAVAAIGPADAWAIDAQAQLTEHWNGTQWSIVGGATSALTSARLTAISADSDTDMWAVGATSTGLAPAIEHWNGTVWSAVPSPPFVGRLSGVNAISATDAWAVGTYIGPTTIPSPVIIEHWDGTAWTIVSSPTISNGVPGLDSLRPDGSGGLWAVGSTWINSGTSEPLAEHWNGMAWSIASVVGGTNYSLTDVATAGPRDTWAIGVPVSGSSTPQAVFHYDGTQWSVVSGMTVALTSVGLVATSAGPTIVGTLPSGTAGAVTWQPPSTSLALTTLPQTSIPAYSGLRAIAGSPDGTAMFAVGSDAVDTGLIEGNTGSGWTRMPISAFAASGSAQLSGVAAVSATNAWAVGETANGPANALALHLTGGVWSPVPVPGTSLVAVTADAATDAWAVGVSGASVIADHWDGTAWSSSPLPALSGLLQGVAALAPNNVWAVGQEWTGSAETPVVLHWDGTSWTTVATPVAATPGELTSVYAASSGDVWAVGRTAAATDAPLIMHWDGTAWSTVPGPSTTLMSNRLIAISGDASNDIWTVSAGGDAVHWNGSVWSNLTPAGTPLNGAGVLTVGGVAWEVGSTGPPANPTQAIGRLCPPPPAPPTAITTAAGNRTVTLTWTPPPGPVDGYVFAAFDAATGYAGSATVSCNSCATYVYTGLASGHTYAFAVYAHNASGWGPAAASPRAQTMAPPAAPTTLTATPGAHAITVGWTPPPGPVDAYAFVAYDAATGYAGYATVSCNSCAAYTYGGLTTGHTYAFAVYAHNPAGWSPAAATPWATAG